jgi:hypothetical protein
VDPDHQGALTCEDGNGEQLGAAEDVASMIASATAGLTMPSALGSRSPPMRMRLVSLRIRAVLVGLIQVFSLAPVGQGW